MKIKDVNPKDKDIAYDEEDKRLLEDNNKSKYKKGFVDGKLEILRKLNSWAYSMGRTSITPLLIERDFIDKEKEKINREM